MKEEKVKSGDILDFGVVRKLLRYAKPYKGRFYFLITLTILLAIAAPLVPIIIGRKLIDGEIATGNMEGLIYWISVLLALVCFQGIVQYLHTYLSDWLGQTIIRDIRVQLYQHLLKLKLKYYDKTPIGRLVTRNISDLETLSDVFGQGMAAIVSDVLLIFVILGWMFYMHWKLTLVSLSTLPFLILSTYIFKEKIKSAFNEVRNAVSNLNTFVQEHITGISVVQIFNREEQEYKKFQEINAEHKKANLRSVLYYAIYFPVAEVIQAAGIGLVIWYGAHEVLKEQGVLPGMLITFIMYLQMFFRPIRMIADRFNTLQLGIVSSDRVFKVLESDEHMDNSGSKNLEHVDGRVEFDQVWFAYNEEEYVLKEVSFQVDPGQSVAIVGATGAGKTTIINLLSRLYEINKGAILLDGVNIKEYELASLRSKIGMVLQDVFLFSSSIMENITLGDKNLEDKAREAAKMVGANKFIDKLPGGFDYNVKERGATLSVGQRQLISFIRAMVYDPAIIVLDEATSSVDTETEEMIQKAIDKLMKGRTSIVIAHRLSTIQKADQILVMEQGKIVERGTHKELLAQSGFYAQLHNMQYKKAV